MKISGPSRGMYFMIPDFLRLMPLILLVPVLLDFHRLLLQKLIHTPLFSCYHRVFFLILKDTAQTSRFNLEAPPRHAHECTVMEASTCWLLCYFYCSGIIFCFHCYVSDQEKPLVSLVVGFCW